MRWPHEHVIKVVMSPMKIITYVFRNFNSDFLTCDCGLHWVPSFFHTSSARLGDETLCAFPMSLRGKQLRGLGENQLSCGKNDLNNVFMNIFYAVAAKNIDMYLFTKTTFTKVK